VENERGAFEDNRKREETLKKLGMTIKETLKSGENESKSMV
jgi:hypothetical protein